MDGIYTPSRHENITLAPHESTVIHDDMYTPNLSRSGKLTSQYRVKLDTDLIDPVLLNDEVALENALCILEGHLQNPAVELERFLQDLASVPNLFEFVYSGK